MHRSRKTSHEVVDGVPVTRVGSPLTVGAVAVAPTLPLWLARAEADLSCCTSPTRWRCWRTSSRDRGRR